MQKTTRKEVTSRRHTLHSDSDENEKLERIITTQCKHNTILFIQLERAKEKVNGKKAEVHLPFINN